jgi:TetR/AcrR family transcriptional regulator
MTPARSTGPSAEPTTRPAAEPTARRRRPEDRRRDADRTRSELIQAAFDEFAARGFAGARVQDIAARTGVDKQLISYYFAGKDGLYQEVLRTQFARDAAVNDPDLPLEDNAARYVRHALADPRLTRLLLWAGLSEDPDNPATLPPASLDLTSMTARQQRGEIPSDLDPAAVLLIVIGAVTAAVALPHVVRAIFDLDPSGPDFEDHYAEQLRALLAHLHDRQPDHPAPADGQP